MMELVKEIPEGEVLGRQEYWSAGEAMVRIIYAARYCVVLLNAPSGMNITRHIYRKLFWFRRRRFFLMRSEGFGYGIHCDRHHLPELTARIERLFD